MEYSTDNRLSACQAMVPQLEHLSEDALGVLIQSISRPQGGWGSSGVVEWNGTKFFVKRIPATRIELERSRRTKNHYNLPAFYSYGLGSAGFGVWRELAAAKRASDWVLTGQCEHFPLLYHHRVRRMPGHAEQLDAETHAEYIEFWNNSAEVGRFLEDRANAAHEVIIVFEWFPYVAADYLEQKPEHTSELIEQMMPVADFMRSNGLIHFDCHPDNIVTDGVKYYLTDFGLALDRDFELSAEEEAFWDHNTYYDHATIVSRLARYITVAYYDSSEDARAQVLKQLDIALEPEERLQLQILLLDHLERLIQAGLLNLDGVYVSEMVKYRQITNLLMEFARAMLATSNKTIQIDNLQLGLLFESIGGREQ